MRPRGFTLLETLVALAIIGIAMAAAAMRSTYFAVDTADDLRIRSAATWVAQNVVNQLLASQAFPEPGASSGKAVQGNREFLWQQEVSTTPNYSFRRVEIKVFTAERPNFIISRQVSYVASTELNSLRAASRLSKRWSRWRSLLSPARLPTRD